MAPQLPTQADWPTWLTTFVDTYQALSVDNLGDLSLIYDENIEFIDPIHRIQGLDNLGKYFASMYENLISCRFVIDDVLLSEHQAAVYWTMSYQHPKLNGGKSITVTGHSLIKGHNSKVVYHRDYLDIGAMLYEHVPLLGRIIKRIKNKVASNVK